MSAYEPKWPIRLELSTYLYTWVARGAVRVKFLAQEQNRMSLARARTRTARSGVELNNHEASAPPTFPNTSKFVKNTPPRVVSFVFDMLLDTHD